jgi:hypothetical protein
MQKLVVLVLLSLFLYQCQSDNKVREEARATATAIAEQSPQEPASDQATASSIIPPEQLAPGQTPPTVAATLALSMGEARVKKGETACLTVRAAGFTDLIGFQFSLRWDPAVLTFVRLDNFQLPHLSATNFGVTQADKGVAAVSWIQPSLTATSLPHQAPVFDICFTANGPAGTAAKVRFASRPTAFEVINAEEEILQLKGDEGTLLIE